MSTLALCLRQNRIAPRYDRPETILLVSHDEKTGDELWRKTFPVEHLAPREVCELLVSLGATHLVCGGVKQECQVTLRQARISFVDNVIGSVEAVLKGFREGSLHPGAILD